MSGPEARTPIKRNNPARCWRFGEVAQSNSHRPGLKDTAEATMSTSDMIIAAHAMNGAKPGILTPQWNATVRRAGFDALPI